MRKGLLPLLLCGLFAASIGAASAADPRSQPMSASYTQAPAQPAPSRIVPVYVDRTFSLGERAKILRAVNEWNHVLNGHIRLDISPVNFDASPYLAAGAQRPEGWIVAKIGSNDPMLGNSAMTRTLAVTVGTRKAIVYVVADRLGTRDLGGIMMLEFGHALGIGHDADSRLMQPTYAGSNQSCIDHGTVLALATAQNLPLEQLNFCRSASRTTAVAPKPTPQNPNDGRKTAWMAIRQR